MIGQIITDKDGKPLEGFGNKLSKSQYQPSPEVQQLFAKVQRDYQVAYSLQHRGFDEFDGYSLLQRSRLDQETFGAFVGAEYVPAHKRWRWRGRKNTARNKIIGILAHLIAGMLYPYVYAKNEENEEDKMTARVMRILVEEHLRKASYETKFLFMVLTALVNPAVFVEVLYVEAMQRVKKRLADGSIKVIEAVDELLSGLNLNIVPIDELLLADFYTENIQRQPYVIRIKRIPWDSARKIYKGKYFDKDGKDLFDYVKAGMTRVFLAGNEGQTLYDIQWTEADPDYVQVLTIMYRDEDLELTWVGGVGMINEKDPYNSNPFSHRRLTLIGDDWISIPIYPYAKSGFEPIDPTGRFAYYKSAAFKEYWDDNALNTMSRLALDGTALDIFKPIFMSGIAKADSTVLVPGATIGMPMDAQVTPYNLGPNLRAAYDAINQQTIDMSESTQDKAQNGVAEPDVTATATVQAEKNARVFISVFGMMMAELIKQVGELTMDCVIMYSTVGEIDTSVPEALKGKFKTFLAKGKEKGSEITNRIVFTDKHMGREYSEDEKNEIEWDLYEKSGGDGSDQRIYEVNPHAFARYTYSMWVDVDKITRKSMGNDKFEKMVAFNIMTDPRVAPFTDRKAVVDDFAIEEYGGDDPERYKLKEEVNPDEMMNAMMGAGNSVPGSAPSNPAGVGAGVGTPR